MKTNPPLKAKAKIDEDTADRIISWFTEYTNAWFDRLEANITGISLETKEQFQAKLTSIEEKFSSMEQKSAFLGKETKE